MILATLETPNFLIQTLAESQAEAEVTMQEYWREHCITTGASIEYFDLDAVRFDDIEIGGVVCR